MNQINPETLFFVSIILAAFCAINIIIGLIVYTEKRRRKTKFKDLYQLYNSEEELLNDSLQIMLTLKQTFLLKRQIVSCDKNFQNLSVLSGSEFDKIKKC